MPYRQTSSTATIRATLFLRFFFIVPFLYFKNAKKAARVLKTRRRLLGARSVFLGGDGGNRVLGYFQFKVVRGYADNDRIVLNREDDAANASGGGHAITRLDRR